MLDKVPLPVLSEDLGDAPNLTTCDKIDLKFTHAFLPAVFITVFVVGTIANFYGLKSVCTGWRKMGNLNVFMLNLGIADLLYLFTLPFLVAYYAHNSSWTFGQTFCKLTRFCFNLNLYGSIGFLTCISIYRYLGIVHPMRVMGKINNSHSVAISAVVWMLVFIQILPDMFFDKTSTNSSNACYDTTADNHTEEYLRYSLVWTITGFVIPLLIILVCYGHIMVVLKANINTLLKQRCLKLVVILTLLFSVCFIPYHIFRNLNLMTRILKRDGTCRASFGDIYIANQIGRGLVSLNSAINPLIYLIGNDDFFTRIHAFSKRARNSLAGLIGGTIYRKTIEAEHEMAIRTHLNPNNMKKNKTKEVHCKTLSSSPTLII